MGKHRGSHGRVPKQSGERTRVKKRKPTDPPYQSPLVYVDRTGWTSCKIALPDEGVVVNTRIDDAAGVRNEQELKRQGRLWFFPDGSMYVYYTPTHWKALPE